MEISIAKSMRDRRASYLVIAADSLIMHGLHATHPPDFVSSVFK